MNAETEEEAQAWLKAFMEHTKCTYQIIQIYPHLKGKHARYKVDLHCHHMRKAKGKQYASRKSKWQKTVLSGLRNKKVQCPSKLTFIIHNPSKATQQTKTPRAKNICNHKTYVRLQFQHNHPLESAHELSFRHDRNQRSILLSFNLGHSASSAEPSEVQRLLADRSVNSTPQDVCRMYANN